MKVIPLFCVVAVIAFVAVHPVMAVVNMNLFKISVPETQSYSNDDSDWFRSPGERQMHDSFTVLVFPNSENWFNGISVPLTDGGVWFPYSHAGPKNLSTETWIDWSEEHVTPANPDGWWSPLSPSGVPASPAGSLTPALPNVIENSIFVNPNGWGSPIIPVEIQVMPPQVPKPPLTTDDTYPLFLYSPFSSIVPAGFSS